MQDIPSGLFAVFVDFAADPFTPEQLEEALGNRIVVEFATPAMLHAKPVDFNKVCQSLFVY